MKYEYDCFLFLPTILWSAWPLEASRDTVADKQTQLLPNLEPVSWTLSLLRHPCLEAGEGLK